MASAFRHLFLVISMVMVWPWLGFSFSMAQTNSSTTAPVSNSSEALNILDYHFTVSVRGPECGDRVKQILKDHPDSVTLLDKNGLPTKNGTRDNLAWGIGYQDCKNICGTGLVAFDFTNFQLQLTSWLLPFLALTAQLPYGASSAWKNMWTCLFAVGCPALLIYGLTLTMLYRRWVRRQFDEILTQKTGGDLVPEHFKRRVKAASYVLQNCHHVPIEIIEGSEAALSSAVTLEENTHLWEKIKREVAKRRQPLTQSLVAQTFWVFVSQLFVWIGSLRQSGDIFTGLGLSSGLAFLWMLPVVWGTYEVGNFPESEAIKDAIESCERDLWLVGKTTAVPRRPDTTELKSVIYQRDALGQERSRTDPFTPRNLTSQDDASGEPSNCHSRHSSSDAILATPMNNTNPASANEKTGGVGVMALAQKASSSLGRAGIPTGQLPRYSPDEDVEEQLQSRYPLYCMWLAVQGDEIETGITMNYARFRSSRAAAMHVITAFKAAKENILKGRNPDGSHFKPSIASPTEDPRRFWCTAEQASQYCDIKPYRGNDALPVFEKIHEDRPPDTFITFCAALFALCVTWGTVGAGIIVAYLTPTSGLGCYSGSILIYGILSTISFLLFWLTSSLSWSYCRWVEECSEDVGRIRLHIVRFPAVTTRIVAKVTAVIAAIWEITSTILSYSNVFSNCWCDTVYFSRKARAYTTLFVDTAVISDSARHIWSGGLALSLTLCIITSILFTSWGRRLGGG